MTFKHLKFEDSPVMRSLEKVAIEKGLVAIPVITKQAGRKDFSTSVNLTENIIKLCNGLRLSNLEAQANELERNYLTYKQAQTLYETSKESGEDLIHSAHPDGSHKIEGIEGDGVVETIIDQHLQHLKMIEKKPTGKLSTAREIISGVKTVLAQNVSNEAQVTTSLNKLLAIMKRIQILSQGEGLPEFSWGIYFTKVNNAIVNPTIDNINTAKKWFNALYSKQSPGIIQGVSDENWISIRPLFAAGNAAIEKALIARQKMAEERTKEVAGDLLESDKPERVGTTVVDIYGLLTSIKSALSTLNGYRAAINTDDTLETADKNTALSWINSRAAAINNIKAQYDSLDNEEEKMAAAPRMLENLKKITAKFNEFYQGWIANA